MWDVLASDQSNFQSSLLLACIESKRHLELIVNLLKAIIPADNPGMLPILFTDNLRVA